MIKLQNNGFSNTSSWGVLLFTLAAAVVPATSFSTSAAAFEKKNATDIESTTVTYVPKAFAEYNPITVMDILRRIPNASSVLAQLNRGRGGRGFGSGGVPILINGKRVSGKSNGVAGSLARIMAKQVERIDLIRGTSSGLDIRSDGLVINIILLEGENKSQTSWVLEYEATEGAPSNVEGTLTHSGAHKGLEYNLTLDKPAYRMLETKDSSSYDADGNLFEDEHVTNLNRADFFKATTNLKYEMSNGDTLHLNGLYNTGNSTGVEDKAYTDIDLVGVSSYRKSIVQDVLGDRTDWEIGGDYISDMGSLGKLKVLFIASQNHGQSDKDRTELTDIETRLISQEHNDSMRREKIIRAAVTTELGARHEIEYGMEGALNSLDKSFNFIDPDDSGDNVVEGTLVKEKRFVGFGSHSFNLSDEATIHSSVNGEYSNIIQEGPANKSRTFFYLKPRFDFRYELNASSQLRAVVSRTVSQLDFDDFAISYNATDNEFEKGNPDLVPEKTWRNSLTYEHRLPSDGGTVEVMAFYNLINDHIDKIAIAPGTQATGNIDDAKQYGMKFKSSFRLASLGLPDAILRADATLQGSSVMDPFTGKNRPLRWRSNKQWKVNFQHDISAVNLSYGMEISKSGQAERTEMDDHIVMTNPLKANAFMEIATFGDMKLRLDARNLLHNRRIMDRTLYSNHIAENNILWQKDQERSLSRKVTLSLRGMF